MGGGSLSKIGGGGRKERERWEGEIERETDRWAGRPAEKGGGGPNVSVINVGETRVRVVSLQ